MNNTYTHPVFIPLLTSLASHRRTLEELEEVFQSKNPAKASKVVVKMKTTRLVDEKGNEVVAVDRLAEA